MTLKSDEEILRDSITALWALPALVRERLDAICALQGAPVLVLASDPSQAQRWLNENEAKPGTYEVVFRGAQIRKPRRRAFIRLSGENQAAYDCRWARWAESAEGGGRITLLEVTV